MKSVGGMKPFPIPVRAAGLSGNDDEEALAVLPLPRAMSTYAAPALDPPAPGTAAGTRAALDAICAALGRFAGGERDPADTLAVELAGLLAADRALLNQVLGEGEVAARVGGSPELQIQESVFAGIWRVVALAHGRVHSDRVEVGAIPAAVAAAAAAAAGRWRPRPFEPAPDTMNAPAVLAELTDRVLGYRPGDPTHVVNLTLLPLSPGDLAAIDAHLGCGDVAILSRGYGNCRIALTAAPRCWRVTYYNSQDTVILDTIEVGGVPEVACAALDDLRDSSERLAELVRWLQAA